MNYLIDVLAIRDEQMSDWFTADVKPDLPGVYEVCPQSEQCINKKIFARWLGGSWTSASPNPLELLKRLKKTNHMWRWRGLKSPFPE